MKTRPQTEADTINDHKNETERNCNKSPVTRHRSGNRTYTDSESVL